jgi:hypothetical protein
MNIVNEVINFSLTSVPLKLKASPTFRPWTNLFLKWHFREKETELCVCVCARARWVVRQEANLWLTPGNRILLENLIVAQWVKFSSFNGTRSSIIVFTASRHSPCPEPDQPSSHASTLFAEDPFLGLPSSLFPSGVPTKCLHVYLFATMTARFPANLTLLATFVLRKCWIVLNYA